MADSLKKSLEAFNNLTFPKKHIFTNGRLKNWIRELSRLKKRVVGLAQNPLDKEEQIINLPLEIKFMRYELNAIRQRSSRHSEFIEFCNQYFSSLERVFHALLDEVNNPLIIAVDHFMSLSFPREEDYYPSKLEDWVFELRELEAYVIGIATNISQNRHFLPKLPLQIQEKKKELEAIQSIDPSVEKFKTACSEYFAALERVVNEIMNAYSYTIEEHFKEDYPELYSFLGGHLASSPGRTTKEGIVDEYCKNPPRTAEYLVQEIKRFKDDKGRPSLEYLKDLSNTAFSNEESMITWLLWAATIIEERVVKGKKDFYTEPPPK